MPTNQSVWISASELAEYVYCHRAWWWRRSGVEVKETPQMRVGTERHEKYQAAVVQSGRGWQLGAVLIVIGILLIALWLALG